MKLQMIKYAGGVLGPALDMELDKFAKLKTGGQYEFEIKMTRNPQFHRKVFQFFNFCFDHWAATNNVQFMDEVGQFDVFRKNLTVFAGYYKEYYNIKGELRIEADSLSFGNMDQDVFEQCYSALINAAIKHVFAGTTDVSIENKLLSFF